MQSRQEGGQREIVQPPELFDRMPDEQTQVFAEVIGKPSVQVKQLVAEVIQVAHGAVQTVQPSVTFAL